MNRITYLALASILVLTACASTHEAEVQRVDGPYGQKGRVQWNDSNLKNLLTIEEAVADRTDGGLLRVRMIVRNRRAEDLWVDVRTTFLDEGGFPKEQTNWEPVCCTARTQTTYQTVSLGSQVADYQVIIRNPRKHDDLP